MHDLIGTVVDAVVDDTVIEMVSESGQAVHRRWGWIGCLLVALAGVLLVSGGLWLWLG